MDMNAEKYLEQVELLTRKIAWHREHLMVLYHEVDGVSSRWGAFSGGSGSGEAPYVRMLDNIEKKKEELAREEDLLNRLRKQAEEIIDTLPEEGMKQVLLYRYLEGKNYVQIADLLFVNRATVTRWKGKAMELLEMPEDSLRCRSDDTAPCHPERFSPCHPERSEGSYQQKQLFLYFGKEYAL